MKSASAANRVISALALLLVAAMFALPLLWVVLASINPNASLSIEFPEHPSLDNFAAVWNWETTFQPLLNSLILCLGATALAVVVAALAAYPLSRIKTKFTRPFLLIIIFSTGLPITAIMIPVYAMFVRVNLVDSMAGTIVFLATSALPYAIFLTKSFMDAVPVELEESAWTEGASTLTSLRRIVLPLIRPGMAVVTIFTFLGMWGNFFVPFMLLLSPDKLPAAVTLYTFSAQYGSVAYGQLAAFSLLYSAPVIALYLFMGRRLGAGFVTAGAVKG